MRWVGFLKDYMHPHETRQEERGGGPKKRTAHAMWAGDQCGVTIHPPPHALHIHIHSLAAGRSQIHRQAHQSHRDTRREEEEGKAEGSWENACLQLANSAEKESS